MVVVNLVLLTTGLLLGCLAIWRLRFRLGRLEQGLSWSGLREKEVSIMVNNGLAVPYPLVCVWWVDSVQVRGWCEIAELPDSEMRCVSTGYLVKETDDAVWLAGHLAFHEDDRHDVQGTMKIPKCAITERRLIEPAQEVPAADCFPR